MTKTLTLSSGFLPHTTESGSGPLFVDSVSGTLAERAAPESAVSRIFFHDFEPPDTAPVPPGFTEIDDLVTGSEKDARRASYIAAARRELAQSPVVSPLARLRLDRGLSQRQLAELIESKQPYIARLEGGTEDIRASTVKRLARALGVPAQRILDALPESE
jgi:DNA-binding Xre family transcriptional regulator